VKDLKNMTQWTVVLRTVASQNATGEWPYLVRAATEAEAIEKAKRAHRVKFPRWSTVKYVQEVVQWNAAA
jgi:hypothetical protein